MKGIEVYRGKVVDEDEYVQGILIGEDKIFQYTEDGEWSVNCGIGCFSIIPETIAYCGKMDIGDLTVLPRTEEVQEYLKNLPKFYLVACWARFRKANVNILEILFSKYYIVESDYKDWFEKLRSYGERICSANKCQTFRTMSGLSMEKYKALKHPYPSIIDKIEKYGYDGKQLHHILRIANFIGRYYRGERFKDCLKVHKNSRENMDKAKLNWFSLGTAESLAKMWDDFTKEIKDKYCEEHKNDPIDEKMYEILNKVKVEAYKMAFRKELSL